mmetsp:Transcript_141387/g.249779  ORF Transcript_141387/g.249779 Transcript_141387/m.249779 type:complete len:126 (-) Transcript_141387:2254-2631(-)
MPAPTVHDAAREVALVMVTAGSQVPRRNSCIRQTIPRAAVGLLNSHDRRQPLLPAMEPWASRMRPERTARKRLRSSLPLLPARVGGTPLKRSGRDSTSNATGLRAQQHSAVATWLCCSTRSTCDT